MNKTAIITALLLGAALLIVAAQEDILSYANPHEGDLLYALLNPTGQTRTTISDFTFPAIPREDIWQYIIGEMPNQKEDVAIPTS